MQVGTIKDQVELYLNNEFKAEGDQMVVLENETIERESYYVFFYSNRKYLETNDIYDMLVGNAPLIVNKFSGEMVFTGTAYPVEHYMEEYEGRSKTL